jgi:hypothetical protein
LVLSDPEEPALEAVALLEEAGFPVEPEEGLLDDIKGVLPVPEDGVGQHEDLLLIRRHDLHECVPVAVAGGPDEGIDVLRIARSFHVRFAIVLRARRPGLSACPHVESPHIAYHWILRRVSGKGSPAL